MAIFWLYSDSLCSICLRSLLGINLKIGRSHPSGLGGRVWDLQWPKQYSLELFLLWPLLSPIGLLGFEKIMAPYWGPHWWWIRYANFCFKLKTSLHLEVRVHIIILLKRKKLRYFLRKEVSLENTLCWCHRNPKLRSPMSCRCNSTEKSLLDCTGQLDLKLAFLFLGQKKVKNQEDFLVVEVGQSNFVALLMIFMTF